MQNLAAFLKKYSEQTTAKLSKQWILILGIILLAGLFYTGAQLGYQLARQVSLTETQRLQRGLKEQHVQIRNLQSFAQNRIDALAIRLARLQAEVLRLNAVGQRIVEKAELDSSEFNFYEIPAQGGEESQSSKQSHNIGSLMDEINGLDKEIKQRSAQLSALNHLIETRTLEQEILPTGKPVKKGFLSSKYGWRTDPFSGLRDFHHGIDISGKRGSPVIAVASGIISIAGTKGGYGNLVEITHGNGYVTRYAHNDQLLVEVGNAVKQGQTIAHLGSTGHATGPHVHFEIIKNGKKANPLNYIRNSRN